VEENLLNILNEDNINEAANKWTQTFMNIVKEYIPNKEVIIRPQQPPWITGNVKHEMFL
jgi:hypothetical protein